MPASRLSLVIPAYNEAAVIRQAVAEAETALGRLFEDYEVIVVDDGSCDGTADLVAGLLPAATHTRLIRHGVNRGYGAALRTGFEAARGPLVAFTDADCQFDLADLGPMADLAAEYPVVVGYRVDRKDPWRRRFLSRGYNLLARTLCGTGVRDVDCALKVFRREVLADLLPDSRGFFVNTEMLTRARLRGYAVTEVPVTHRPRLGGESKVSLREVPRTFRTLVGFWWREVVTGRRPEPVTLIQTRVATSPIPSASPRQASAPPLSSAPAPQAGPRGRRRATA
ncbi:MAG: glycosyltransferase family 2 protein [Gemmataceae bacterium]|nr:glycosyltransferase family 2 protein [Gemmataceae bacterium]